MLQGFELWVPPVPLEFDDGMPYYEIIGTDAQIVQFPLKRGRQIMCFSGAMAYMSDGIKMDVQLAGFQKTFGRLAGGGSLFQVTYTNESGDDNAYIACTGDYPGVIVPMNMSSTGKIICLRDSFLCATVGLGRPMTNISAGFNPASNPISFCCSGIDFIVQTVENGEYAFLMAMGTVIKKTLRVGESILVDGDSVLAFESSVTVDVRAVGNIAAICCGGEGIFNTELSGPGTIYLQSMSIDKLRRLFPPHVSSSSGDGDGG
ncbi:mitochondrial biogenesis AIM24 [Nitzschia inconspicua]|uniref:Mitochondrial biogenesis AIM24 n=1 Tax=Nitzschia inconspicua TaxID=303405 RepID=A0A9K3LFH2_9STRA|nr:mitochondrial biogenesis AIM24 [Nitzschia inconspicua]